jgi:DNA-binding response OmpR family regulator
MSRGSLLLIDDDRHVLESMADWLRQQGYKVDTAADRAGAIATIGRT